MQESRLSDEMRIGFGKLTDGEYQRPMGIDMQNTNQFRRKRFASLSP